MGAQKFQGARYVNFRGQGFTQVSNVLIRDKRLSNAAKGLAALLLSVPDGWEYRLGWILSQSTDGKHRIQSQMDELKLYGYMVQEQQRAGAGRYSTNLTAVTDDPALLAGIDPGNGVPLEAQLDALRRQLSSQRQTDFPSTENPPLINTDFNKMEKKKKKKTHVPSGTARPVEYSSFKGESDQSQVQKTLEWEKQGAGDSVELGGGAGTGQKRRRSISEQGHGRDGRAAATPDNAQALLDIWNEGRDTLPRATLTPARKTRLLSAHKNLSLAFPDPLIAFRAAVRCCARDDYWKRNRYGLDNLLSKEKYIGKAEAMLPSDPAPSPTLSRPVVGEEVEMPWVSPNPWPEKSEEELFWEAVGDGLVRDWAEFQAMRRSSGAGVTRP